MARVSIEKRIKEGEALAVKNNCQISVSQMEWLREEAGNRFFMIAWAYHAGVAAGYKARKREEKKKRDRERIRKEGKE